MKLNKLLALLLAVIFCLISCQEELVTSDSSSSESVEASNIEAGQDSKIELPKNLELKATRENSDYYPIVYAGNYLGADLPDEDGCYYREILTFEDFSSLVENPNAVDKEIFDESFVLVIKRKLGSYLADIGFKNYDSHFKSIESDSYYISQGTDDVKTHFDYIIVPKYKAQADEDHSLTGALQINESVKAYYEVYSRPAVKEITQGAYFEDIQSANEYLTQNGYDGITNPYQTDYAVLMLSLNMRLDFGIDKESSNLGFCNFNTNGSDIYVTLERSIINNGYGTDSENRVICIMIPKTEICTPIADTPSIHILVSDSLTDAKNG